eukprot:CAMPEP_0195054466 /NCGR_PEP_ID=MMETSP0448-20130528/3411_1 /TAXON_ID=66468 /ORGANISM="Heterocapsa triquestra, Strain CCMP 448" /LENGTH=52 /DNA_ID=CAMNT_0040083981 /DNA_START=88 /DNA_END=243 /DNA_ORIENTATION=-
MSMPAMRSTLGTKQGGTELDSQASAARAKRHRPAHPLSRAAGVQSLGSASFL